MQSGGILNTRKFKNQESLPVTSRVRGIDFYFSSELSCITGNIGLLYKNFKSFIDYFKSD